MDRRDGTILPGSVELAKIMDAEAKRDFPPGKENAHYADFQPFVRLLSELGLPADLFSREYAPAEVLDAGIMEQGNSLIAGLVERLAGSRSVPEAELAAAYGYLAEEDAPEAADLIFTFGAKTTLRVEKAVTLYKAGLAPRLVFSGRSPNYADNETTEAEQYRQYALEHGVPDQAILTENNSITIPDNIRSSLNLLDERGETYRSLILVNSPYVQRRGWCVFRKYLPDNVKLIRQNCGTAPKFSRNEWFRTPEGIKTVANEYIKMKVAVSINTA